MEPVPEIDLAELVEECIPIARKEFADKIRYGRYWASYWAEKAQETKFEYMMEKLEKRHPSSPWLRPY